jgi:hypothetical protein
MKKTINIISLLALVITLFIVIISCGTGVKFNNILGSSSIGGGGGNGGNNLSFPLFFDGQYPNDYETFSSIVPTSDGGYFITGRAIDYTQDPPIDDALFVKLNRDLTIAWSKLGSIGISGTFGFEKREGEDSYYYACGYASNGFFISKLNSDGTTNTIIYFSLGSDQDITFILPAENGIISNAGGISKFDFNLEHIWNISNLNWGDANFITSDNETVGYVENTSNDRWLVKLNVSDDDVNNVISNSQDAYISGFGSNTVSFLGGIEGNNVFYFGFQNYTQNRFYLIKTDINLNKQGEVSISGRFNVSLVPEPSSNNVILALYDRSNNNLVLIKLDSTLNVNNSTQVKISKFRPYYEYYNVMYFIPLASNFLIPGEYDSNGLIYTFDYNLTPPCGNTSPSNLNLQNTNSITINTNHTTHPTLQSGDITVYFEDTATTDYQLTEINACPIN